MITNTMADLHNILMEQIARLNGLDLNDEEASAKEMERANAISNVAGKIVANGDITIKAIKLQYEMGGGNGTVSGYLTGQEDK